MNGKNTLQFLNELIENNNRDWFADNKDRYTAVMEDFEQIVNSLILQISEFDKEVAGLQAKECIFRIYRDVRFSHDKSPYKNHFGAYICAKGGRKSLRAGYYLHLQPGNCMISGGLWCPPANVLKATREAIVENIDEFKEIVESDSFASTFTNMEEKLKNVPRGFPKDFPDAEYLKFKHYAYTHKVADSFFDTDDCFEKTVDIFKRMQPINRFLNFTVNETLED